jgi:UDP-N-acetylglucosamine--N-acetylmuramyl-(pentapeptide) pyrophosphoryl-undecaprenol N-acetylglucosamine transferase
MEQYRKIIISGGGTGGHIYPAIAIAQALKKIDPGMDILFVGASGKMEMDKIPAAGFEIIGLPVTGLKRTVTLKNVGVMINLLFSMVKARKIIRVHKPDVVVGVGGYASGPILTMAARKKIPTLIQEQNSYPGITNKILAKKTDKICVAYEGMEKFFPAEKIVLTGNPVREELEHVETKREEGLRYFNLNPGLPVILILGGSLGAKTINESVWNHLDLIAGSKIQCLWQTGKLYYAQALEKTAALDAENLKVHEFIYNMDLAYSVADLVVSRAGAGTISELCIVGKPAILIPSPNVAEDHQTKNANALVGKGAAILVTDQDAEQVLIRKSLDLVVNKNLLADLGRNIGNMAIKNSAEKIAGEIITLMKQ